MTRKWILVTTAVTFLLGLVAFITYYSFPQTKEREWQHIVRVLLRGEAEYRTPIVWRWISPVRIRIEGASPDDIGLITAHIVDINKLLLGSEVRLSISKSSAPEIGIGFVADEQFQKIARKVGIKNVPSNDNGGMFYYEGAESGVIDAGFVLIAHDLVGLERRRTILEEIYQVLGPFNDSPFFENSIVYDDDADYYFMSATEVSDLDRKLLRFLYLHLKPGDDIDAVRRAYDAHWQHMIVPPRLLAN